jgi:hypothetical protein
VFDGTATRGVVERTDRSQFDVLRAEGGGMPDKSPS